MFVLDDLVNSMDNQVNRQTKDLQDVFINYLPALNKTHTYNLVATLYPYATQPVGEVAYQVDFLYTFQPIPYFFFCFSNNTGFGLVFV